MAFVRQQKEHRCCDALFVGGEGEIRTLEPCYRLHDFQSCALDQLGDFSIFCYPCIISQIKNKINTFFDFSFIFFRAYEKIRMPFVDFKDISVSGEQDFLPLPKIQGRSGEDRRYKSLRLWGA